MRAILFCCSLMVFSCSVALAQKSQSTATTQTVNSKALFVSNITKFDGYAQRGGSELCNKTYNELINSMEMQVSADKKLAKNLSGDERKTMNDKIAEEIRIIRDAADMGNEDKVKNREAIKAKMEAFIPYMAQ